MWENHLSTLSFGWREFLWKSQTRFLFFIFYISSYGKQLMKDQMCWRLCKDKNSNHTHMFWICPVVQIFWKKIYRIICKVLDYKIPYSCCTIYIGHLKGFVNKSVQNLVKILLAAGRQLQGIG